MKKEIRKIYIITGGARGIGIAIGKLLLRKNYNLAIIDILLEQIEKNYKKEIIEKSHRDYPCC